MNDFVWFLICFWWLIGIVEAVGFWSTTISILFPPWGMYLATEWIVNLVGGL